ncbi:unnamed protein product [Phaedon cochleariae]|uniref:Cuticular protein n=1 Tax=Phaedon cochleariae TaxID=80249 RepID=A0A9N9SMD8_PHACE|nr:unnamed protein product [Phaedon cochleariae]
MSLFRYLAVLTLLGVSLAQDYYDEEPRPRPAPARIQSGYSGAQSAPRPTPVAILKQINRHNEDGSYTYGYEAADGTFKIETKQATGEVRVVEYGADKHGFDPSGEGITVPPPTLVDESARDGQQQDGQYYEPQAPVRPARPVRPRPQPQPQQSFEAFSPPQHLNSTGAAPAPAPADVQHFDFGPPAHPAPARSFAPAPRPRPAPAQFGFDDDGSYEQRPAPRMTYAQPAPQQYAPRPAPQYKATFIPQASGRGGILDQLSKDYALPNDGAAPLHDISFGYY